METRTHTHTHTHRLQEVCVVFSSFGFPVGLRNLTHSVLQKQVKQTLNDNVSHHHRQTERERETDEQTAV